MQKKRRKRRKEEEDDDDEEVVDANDMGKEWEPSRKWMNLKSVKAEYITLKIEPSSFTHTHTYYFNKSRGE